MLTAYRRHRKNCEHRPKGRKYRRCRCPIWADGFLGQQEIRQSLGTADWEKGQSTIREWEATGKQVAAEADQPVTIEQAKNEFISDAEARNLNERTIYKFKFLFNQLLAFAKANGIVFLADLDTRALRQFRATWKDGNMAAAKKLERLRSFFRFACENKWVTENPAKQLKKPQVTMRPTLPFTHDEVIRILSTASKKIEAAAPEAKRNARRLRALVLLLRYTGLRIGDVVRCSVERLSAGKLRLYTQKTGTHVHCPLPDFVVDELAAVPKRTECYWFWTGASKLKTAVSDWQGRLQTLFGEAQVVDGHAHRFRDTFAVELLLEGVPIERVSVLLGHTSIRVTERHYSPWIRERQEQAESDIRRSWIKDPLVLLETKGTPEVHEKEVRPN